MASSLVKKSFLADHSKYFNPTDVIQIHKIQDFEQLQKRVDNVNDKITKKDFSHFEKVKKKKSEKSKTSVIFEVDLGNGDVENILLNSDDSPSQKAKLFCEKHNQPEYVYKLISEIFSDQKKLVEANLIASNPVDENNFENKKLSQNQINKKHQNFENLFHQNCKKEACSLERKTINNNSKPFTEKKLNFTINNVNGRIK